MTRFATSFISSIDGTSTEISTKELCGGAHIYYIFNSVFGSSLESIDPTSNLSALDIRTAIRNSTGPRPSLFVPEMAFDLLVKPQIKLLEIPSQRCVELVYEELIKICHTCGSTELSRYPRLQAKLIETVSDLLRERLGPASSYVESLISIQRAYINTNHPNFLGAAAAMSNVVTAKQERERKRLIQEERERRERRRLQEIEADGDGPENEDGVTAPNEKAEKTKSSRSKVTKPPRSLSPPVLENGNHPSIAAAMNASNLNGIRSASPSRLNQQGLGGARDSFLNYFFGKDGANMGATGPLPSPTLSNGRHISQHSETSFPIVRREKEIPHRPSTATPQPLEDEFDRTGKNYGLASQMGESAEPAMTEREAMETELIRALISSYFNIVRESIADQVPKAVMHLPSSTTARTLSRTASSASSTRSPSLRSCCTRTTASRRSARSASACCRRTARPPRLLVRCCRRIIPLGCRTSPQPLERMPLEREGVDLEK
ncbi:Dynamin- GTPase protein [Fusarium falciforme]|nr:Dynamin- GTPase protein [Fusarium falciforme]